jgi:hypothetical protein
MDNLLRTLIQDRWWNSFEAFVETGEASQTFLDYLDSDKLAQRAAELMAEKKLADLCNIAAQHPMRD